MSLIIAFHPEGLTQGPVEIRRVDPNPGLFAPGDFKVIETLGVLTRDQFNKFSENICAPLKNPTVDDLVHATLLAGAKIQRACENKSDEEVAEFISQIGAKVQPA